MSESVSTNILRSISSRRRGWQNARIPSNTTTFAPYMVCWGEGGRRWKWRGDTGAHIRSSQHAIAHLRTENTVIKTTNVRTFVHPYKETEWNDLCRRMKEAQNKRIATHSIRCTSSVRFPPVLLSPVRNMTWASASRAQHLEHREHHIVNQSSIASVG